MTSGDTVTVRWESDLWLPAIIERVYERGADCVIGSRGCFYVRFEDIRYVRA